jgi:nitrilase
LICWENRMPLARWALYQQGPQIWVAPTADDSDGWLASMRHISIESGAFVVSVPQFIPRTAFPADFPVALPDGDDVFGRGGAAIIAPNGGVLAGPLYDAEGIVAADCDLRRTLEEKRWFDVVGHYARADVLARTPPPMPPPSQPPPDSVTHPAPAFPKRTPRGHNPASG